MADAPRAGRAGGLSGGFPRWLVFAIAIHLLVPALAGGGVAIALLFGRGALIFYVAVVAAAAAIGAVVWRRARRNGRNP